MTTVMGFNRNQPRDSKGRWTKSGLGVGAAGLACVVALSDSAGVLGGAADVGAGNAFRISARATKATKNAQRGDEKGAWKQLKVRRIQRKVERGLSCVAQSTDEVQRYLLTHPCRSLDQVLFTLADGDGSTIAVTVMWIRMGSGRTARGLREIERRQGSGDITPIGTQVLQASGFRFTGLNYADRLRGTLLTVAETDSLHGDADGQVLRDVEEVSAFLPKP